MIITIELAFVLGILAVDLVLLVGVTVIIRKLNFMLQHFGRLTGVKKGKRRG